MSNTIYSDMTQHNDCVKKSDLISITNQIKQILKDLNGNGRPGLKETVTKMEALFYQAEKLQAENNKKLDAYHNKLDDFMTDVKTDLRTRKNINKVIAWLIGSGTFIIIIKDIITNFLKSL